MASFVFHARISFQLSFVFFILLHSFFGFSSAHNEWLYNNCDVSAKYTTPSMYQKNFNTLLTGFSTNINKYGYHSGSIGDNPDSVTAIALCRGDVELSLCRTCVDESIANITRICPDNKEAVIWSEYCMFRYTDKPVPYGSMVWGPGFDKYSIYKDVPPQFLSSFNETRTKLLNGLRDQAASSSIGALRKFAVGDGKITDYETMYSLVQCTPDLTPEECKKCINACMERISTFPSTSAGGAVYKPTCHMQYEVGASPFWYPISPGGQ